jgi:membrane protease YdiL (CAAX protease family)
MKAETTTQSNSADSVARASMTDRALATWEIISITSSVIIAEWMLATAAGWTKAVIAIPVALALIVIFVSQRVRGESLADIGFRRDNFFRALSLLAGPVIVVAIICLLIGWRFGAHFDFLRWHFKRFLAVQLALGFCWGLIQQYVLQGFINRRATIVFGRGWLSIFAVALIFAVLHLPNPWLTFITFVAGAVWATIYQRAPNLFALAISHSVMTWFIVSTLPSWALNHLRVGLGYFF